MIEMRAKKPVTARFPGIIRGTKDEMPPAVLVTPRGLAPKELASMRDQSIPCTTEETTEYELISRDEARARGLKVYFTGEPCRAGHISVRYVGSNHCRECMRLVSKRHYDVNRDQLLERQANQRAADPDAAREAQRRHTRRFRERDPLRAYVQSVNAAAKVRGALERITVEEWSALLDAHGHRCLRCGRDDVSLTADHVIPIIDGGANTIANIQPLCLDCNRKKNAKHIDYRMVRHAG